MVKKYPPSVLRYLRKNPKALIKRLYDVYGEKLYDYISDYSNGTGNLSRI